MVQYGEILKTKKMFLGEYFPNMTEGNRVALPKKHRDQIKSNKVILTKGFEKCVLVYEYQDWSQKAQKQIDNLSEANLASVTMPRGGANVIKKSDLERFLYTSAVEATIDAQGRVVLSPSLLEYTGIKDETAIVGVGDHIEIWNRAVWQEHLKNISQIVAE